jgi:predicted metalloprotease
MRWQMGRRSDNIEDQRGMPVGRGAVVGGGIGTVVLVLLALWFGVDPSVVLQGADPGDSRSAPSAPQQRAPAGDEPLRDFVSVILADTEDTWTELFRQMGRQYQAPHLVLFSGAIKSACGFAEAAVGPFYCPGDRKVYIDLSFYRDLRDKIGAPGDFAQAYVIAHEVGHHVQNLLGIAGRIQEAQGKRSRTEANALQVKMELQADCLAGVWANNAQRARQILESGDIEEGLNAAAAIGDDRLQRQAQGRVVPESFTHGSCDSPMWKRGTRSRSSTTTLRPRWASAVAAVEPPGPPPMTATS